MDITQAFSNKVCYRELEQKLNSSAIPKYILNTNISFISNQTFQIWIETNFSQLRNVQAEVP